MKKNIKLAIIIFLSIITICCGIMVFGIREQRGPTKEQYTGAKVSQWAGYFRLYHELNKPPAPDLETVLDTVSGVFRKDPNIAKDIDENAYNETKKQFVVDSWGGRIIFRYEMRSNNELWVVVTSKGPDGKIGTADDFSAEIRVVPRHSLPIPSAKTWRGAAGEAKR